MRRRRLRNIALVIGLGAVATGTVVAVAPTARADAGFEVESLDGGGNNVAHPDWGRAGGPYARVGPARYADGTGRPVDGPDARAISNRIFNDTNVNIVSERRVSQWGWVWGQFLDHTFGHRAENGPSATPMNVALPAHDPMESFRSNLGVMAVNRSVEAPGTGTGPGNPRQQTNTRPSFLDASPVYGTTSAQLDWLRAGPVDGDPTDNSAALLLPGGYLPTRGARGNPATAPPMDVDGRLAAAPQEAVVAGDARANENIALTATQTLFAREHNRIVAMLPARLSEEDKFQIARRVVIAEQQYITYQEFLPAMGVALPAYHGYDPGIDPTLTDEFATVGYRAHSQIHGDGFNVETAASRYSRAQLAAFVRAGLTVTPKGADVKITIPLGVGFFNPGLVRSLQLGPVLQSVGADSQYRNDVEIDNQLRSTLFQVPTTSNASCLNGPTMPNCFGGITDLGALDIQRGRDHGTGTYNQLRQAYGLAPKTSFTAITGEATDAFPADPALTRGHEIDDPNSLDILAMADIDGRPIDPNQPKLDDGATSDVRRTTVAARLRAIYGSVDRVDAFVGVSAEPHVPGSELGETELAMWTREFTRLRDGDRFFYGNDPALARIAATYGIDYRHTLAQIIEGNTDIAPDGLNPTGNVFLTPDAVLPPTTCTVSYAVTATGPHAFRADVAVTNTGTDAVSGWALRFDLANGQTILGSNRSLAAQRGPGGRYVTILAGFFTWRIPPGRTVSGISFTGTFDGTANAAPPNVTLNRHRCSVD
jgi:hypothetical protein